MGGSMTFDVENGLREIARARASGNELLRETATLADQVAAGMRGDFAGVLDMETCGKAFVIAAASVVPLCGPDIPAAVIANLIGMAGENLVREARNA